MLGRVSDAEATAWLEVAGAVLTLATTVLAAVYSRTSTVTTVSVPASQVVSVRTSAGELRAVDGTVLETATGASSQVRAPMGG